MRDTNVSRTTTKRALAPPHTSPAGEQTGQMAQAFKRAAADHAHIAQRAYELYEQRGRQEGRDLEDWLKAERELCGAVHHA
jgi:outer membrane protein TolC